MLNCQKKFFFPFAVSWMKWKRNQFHKHFVSPCRFVSCKFAVCCWPVSLNCHLICFIYVRRMIKYFFFISDFWLPEFLGKLKQGETLQASSSFFFELSWSLFSLVSLESKSSRKVLRAGQDNFCDDSLEKFLELNSRNFYVVPEHDQRRKLLNDFYNI